MKRSINLTKQVVFIYGDIEKNEMVKEVVLLSAQGVSFIEHDYWEIKERWLKEGSPVEVFVANRMADSFIKDFLTNNEIPYVASEYGVVIGPSLFDEVDQSEHLIRIIALENECVA